MPPTKGSSARVGGISHGHHWYTESLAISSSEIRTWIGVGEERAYRQQHFRDGQRRAPLVFQDVCAQSKIRFLHVYAAAALLEGHTKANTAVTVNITVIYTRWKGDLRSDQYLGYCVWKSIRWRQPAWNEGTNLRRFERIILREIDVQEKNSMFIWRSGWAHDCAHPLISGRKIFCEVLDWVNKYSQMHRRQIKSRKSWCVSRAVTLLEWHGNENIKGKGEIKRVAHVVFFHHCWAIRRRFHWNFN